MGAVGQPENTKGDIFKKTLGSYSRPLIYENQVNDNLNV